MILQCDIPDALRRSLAERLPDDREVRYAARSDLDADRRFGEHYVLVTGENIVTAGPCAVLEALPLSAVKEVRVDELFGSARLVAVLDHAGNRPEPGREPGGLVDLPPVIRQHAVVGRRLGSLA